MTTQAANNTLWRNSSFILLWCGTILSAMADGAFFILLSWFIVDVTGSEAMLGTTLICMSIPRLLFMLAGEWQRTVGIGNGSCFYPSWHGESSSSASAYC